MVLCTSWIYIS